MADEKPDPITDMLAIDDERARSRTPPEAELNVDPPADKKPPERDETGKFKGKDDPKKPDADDPKKPDAKVEEPKDVVPLAKYLEVSNSLKKQVEEGTLTNAQLRKELDELKAKLAPTPKEPPEPDFVENPKGYVDHKLEQALKGIEEANKKAEATGKAATETATQAAEQVQVQQFFTNLQSHEQRFVAANPDYHDALAHLRTVRAAQLREFSPQITQEQIVATIRQEEQQLAIQLHRQGRDPVQTAYNLARHFGYQKKAADPPAPGATDVAKLPDVPNRRLPPDQTLGSGSSEETPVYGKDETDPVDVALASLKLKRA